MRLQRIALAKPRRPIRAALMPRQRRIFSSTFRQSESMRIHQALPRESWHVVQPVSCRSDVYAGAHVRHRPVAQLPSIKLNAGRNSKSPVRKYARKAKRKHAEKSEPSDRIGWATEL